MMNRKDAREMMMKIVYQLDVNNMFGKAGLREFFGDDGVKTGNQEEYCERLFDSVNEHREEIDAEIGKYSLKRKTSRMAKTDIAIMRVAAAEIMYLDDIPDSVSVNEAVELAKKYGTDNAPRFINAILGRIIKEKEGSGS